MISLKLNKLCQPFVTIMQYVHPERKEYYDQVITVSYYLSQAVHVDPNDIMIIMTVAALCGLHDETKNKDKVFMTSQNGMLQHDTPYAKIFKILQQQPTLHPQNSMQIHANIIHLSKVIVNYILREPILKYKNQLVHELTHTYDMVIDEKTLQAAITMVNSDIFLLRSKHQKAIPLFEEFSANNVQLSIDDVVLFGVAIAEIIDQRSTYTLNHSIGVAQISRVLAHLVGMSEWDAHRLYVAGLLHDLGKTAIPAEIINKPGKLTEEEYNLIKEHTFYTYQIIKPLESMEFFKDIVRWACSHHERYDGSGYLYGKDKTIMDIGTNIIIYADIIVALQEDRPYRSSFDFDQVIQNLSDLVQDNKLEPTLLQVVKQHKNLIEQTFTLITSELTT